MAQTKSQKEWLKHHSLASVAFSQEQLVLIKRAMEELERQHKTGEYSGSSICNTWVNADGTNKGRCVFTVFLRNAALYVAKEILGE
jgi:heat shock protein HslJ